MDKEFNYKETSIHYTISGNGLSVVLLHGFAEDGRVWDEQVKVLQAHCRVIVPDLPGSGKSSKLQQEKVAMEDYADLVYALVVFENIEKFVVLGHSMGGYIALAIAARYANEIAGFGFVHSTAFADSDEKKNTRRKGIQFINKYGAYPFIKNATPNLFSALYKKQHPEKINELIENGRDFSKEALMQYYAAMIERPDRTNVLEKSKVPVLFIVGSEDAAAPLEDLLKQVHLPSISFIHILKEVGHMGMWERPFQVNEYLLAFIRYCNSSI